MGQPGNDVDKQYGPWTIQRAINTRSLLKLDNQ